MAKGKVDNAGEIITDKKMGYFVSSQFSNTIPELDENGNPKYDENSSPVYVDPTKAYTGFDIVTSGVTGSAVAGDIFAGTVNSVTVTDILNVYGGGTYSETNTFYKSDGTTETVTRTSEFDAEIENVTVNGGTLILMAGETAPDETLYAGSATHIILQDGAVSVGVGALATNATLNGGVMEVGAGGSANIVKITTNGGHLTGDGVITKVTMNRALSDGTGNYTYASAFDFIHINRITSAILNFSGGMITSGENLHLIGSATVGGGADNTHKLYNAIVSGGTLNVQNNGIVEDIGVFAIQTGASSWESGTLHVQSGTASNVSVGSHAVLDVDFNVNGMTFAAVADTVTISSGGTLTGLGRATNVTMSTGAMAEFQVSANQIGANSRYESTYNNYLMTHIGNNAGTLNVLGGYVIGTANNLHFSGTLHAIRLEAEDNNGNVVFTIGTGIVQNTTVDAVSSGGSARLVIASGGTGTNVTAQNYGVLQVSSGGYINVATVNANALVDIHVGGSAGTVNVDNGGNYRVIIGQGTEITDLNSNGADVLTNVTSEFTGTVDITGAGNVIGVGYGGTAENVTVGSGATLEVNGKDGLNEHYIGSTGDYAGGGTVTGNITISSGGLVSGSWIRHAEYNYEQVSGNLVSSLLDYYQMASAGFTNVGTSDIVISANGGTPAMSAGQVTGIITGGTYLDAEGATIGTAAISGTMYVAPGGEISNIRYSAGTIVLRDESPRLRGSKNGLDAFIDGYTSATNITLDYSTEGTGATMLVDRGAVLNGGRINYFDPSAIGTPFHQFQTATIRVNGYASDIHVYNSGSLIVTNSYVPSRFDPAYLTDDWSAQWDSVNNRFVAVYSAVYERPDLVVPEYSAWTSSLNFGDFDTAGNMKFAVVSGVTVYSAGVLTAMDDTFVLSAVLSSGGRGTVQSGAWMSGATIFNEGLLSVQSGGSAYGIDVSAGQGAGLGGRLDVDGNVTSTILRGLGADMYVNDGGVATSNLVHSEARIIVNSGGQLVDTLISGGSRPDPENPSAYIYFGGGTVILDGGSATSTWIYEGGVLNMQTSGAYASETTLSAGGEMNVAEGIAEVIHLSAGGTLNLYNQGTTISALVNDDAVFNVNNTGLASQTVIFSGGTAIASANTGRGGMLGVAVSSGGLLILSSGGRADNVDIARDESYFTNSTMASRGGTLLFADSTGVANDINLSMGGLVRYRYDGKWHEFYNAYRQSAFVTIKRLSGGVLTGNMHEATLAGDIYVGNGGVASAITIENGGYVTILNGGRAVSTTLNALSSGQSGGITGSSGATLVAVNLGSGNSMTMMNGVNATGIVISSGGLYNFVVDGNTTLEGYYIHSNGEVRFNIVNGQNRQWPGGENGSAVTVSEGGRYLLLNGANFNNVAISSGGIIDMEGGSVTLATIASGGHLNLSGGFASNVTAENSASLRVSGGVLSQAFVNNAGTTFEVGGYLSDINTLVYGTVRDVTVSSGGVVNVTNGGQIIDAKLVASDTVMNVTGGSALNMTLSSGTINVVSGTSTFDAYFANNGTTVTSAFYTEAFYNQVATAAGTGPVYVITTDPATGSSTPVRYDNLDTFHRNTYCSSIETAAGVGTVSYTPAGGDAIVYSSMEAFYDSSYYEIIEEVAGVNGVTYDNGAGTANTYTNLEDLIDSHTTPGTDDVAILSALLDSTGATLKIGETVFRDFDSFDSFTYLESILNNGTISAGGSTFGSVDEFDSVGHLSATLGSGSFSAGGVTYTSQSISSSYVGYVSSMTLNGGVTLSAGIGAVMNVISGTSKATDAIVNISGGSATALDFVAGTVHVSGTADNNGYVSNAVIQSVAEFNVGDYGYAEDVNVVSGGSALVSGGIGSNVTIGDQGTLTLQATTATVSGSPVYTGSINDLNVLEGGVVSATANTSVTDADVAGTLNIDSANATDVLVSGSVALLNVAGDADVTSLTVTGNASAVLSAGTFTSVTVDDTAVINISGGSMTSAWINSAGIMTMTGGALSGAFVDDGTLNISGGQANELQLDGADGELNVSGMTDVATQVASVTILNGSANIQTSATVSGVTVNNGILNISGAAAIVSGGAVNGGTVNVDENGLLTGVDTTDHLGVAGGVINVNNGGSAALLNVSGTAAVGEETPAVSAILNVNSGGSVSETVITGEGVMYVSGADAIADGISIENGGSAAVQSAGKITSATITSAALDVLAGGSAATVAVREGAVMDVDGANASATDVAVSGNGTLNVSALAAVTGATLTGALVTTPGATPGDPATTAIHSAVMNVYADGTANTVTVNEYGYLNNEGTVSNVTLNSAATLAGSGIAHDLTLNSGAYVDNTLGSGFMVLNTSSATLGQMSGGVIQGSNTGLVFSGDAILGGTASGFVVSGGAFTVLNGATANDTEVSATAQMIVSGTASGGTVFAGGTQTIAAGGSAQNVTVAGVQSAAEGATADSTTVQSGGLVTGEGALTNIRLESGGQVQAGDADPYAHVGSNSAFLAKVSSGVILGSGNTGLVVSGGHVMLGGEASGFILTDADISLLDSNTIASATTMTNGVMIVSAGASALDGTITGGSQLIRAEVDGATPIPAGYVSGYTISNGYLENAGLAERMTLVGGSGINTGTLNDAEISDTIFSNTAIASDVALDANAQFINSGSGAVVSGITGSNGAVAKVYTGGSAYEMTLDDAGSAFVSGVGNVNEDGQPLAPTRGYVSSAVVDGAAAKLNVQAYGLAENVAVREGTVNVFGTDAVLSNVAVSGGLVSAYQDGYVSQATVTGGVLNITGATGSVLTANGGEIQVFAGGVANEINLSSGTVNVSGTQNGAANVTDLDITGGTAVISSFASATDVDVADGTMNVAGGIAEDVIQSGGTVNVTETGYVSSAVITNGSMNITNASGTDLDLSGTAEVNVNAGGSANLIDVADGTLNVSAGIVESMTQSGGEVNVEAEGYVSAAAITAGELNITNASGTALDLSGTAEVNVNAGGSANVIDVAGGTMNVISGVVEEVTQSGGTVNVTETGYISATEMTGGELNITNASGTELNISGDAVANILANGSANMIGISGGALNVSAGIAENVMQSGGVVTARDGGYISAATVAAGDMVFDYNAIGHDINISGGNVSANMSDLTQVDIGAGYLFATNGATVSGMTQSGGSAVIGYEAVLSTVAITDGRLTVSGGDAYDVTMNDNAVVEGFTGSFCDVKLNNGLLNVSGGLVSGMVQAGGEANMDAGVVLSASIVRDGELNLSAAVAWDLNVSGGTVNGTAGASSYRMNVSGGIVNMTDGAYISATTQVGGEINVANNAVASSVAVSDGVINITDGGSIREIELSGAGQAFVENATAVDADITGGSMFVNVSGSVTSGVISNDGILAISGTGATGTELDLVDGTLTVEDAAYISAVRQSGGVATVDNATAEDVLLTGGEMDVVNAATITSATVQNGSLNIMSATGTDLVLDELAGATAAINVQTEGSVTNVTLTSGYLNVSGTAAEVTSVTMTNGIMNVFDAGRVNEVAFDGGTVNISGTSALISGMVQTDGVVYVQSAGTLQTLTMSAGTVNVSGASALATDVVMDGGEMEVIASGTVSGMLMNNDTTLNVSGGFGNDLDINGASAEVNVSDNGYISTVRLSAGTVNVATGSGADIDLYDGTLNISAGGIVEDIRQSGGLLDVKADGLASNVVMSENTTMYVAGNAVDGTINSGAVQYITSGGAAEGFTVFGTQMISAGATASDTTAESGGLIDNEGTLTTAEIKSGAVLEMAADAIATDVALHRGGMIADSFTHMGNTAVNLGQLSGTMIAGAVDGLILSGTVETTSGADLTNTELGSGTMTMFGGTADTVKVNHYTTLTVNDTAVASSVTVLNHGEFYVNEGGTAATAMLSSGAVMNVSGVSAIASAVNVYYGAELNVLSAGVVDGAVLSGRMSVTNQGSEIISRIHSAVMTVGADAYGSNVTLDAYGYLINEGTVDGAIVKNKGVLSGDGTAYDVTISSGGEAIGYIHGGSESVLIGKIYDGYIAGEVSGTLMISGGLSIGSGADVSSPEILNGGTLHVLSSAVASSAVLSNGGAVNISNGGLVAGVDGEGTVNILSGGTLSGAFLWNEGAANVSNGGIGYDITLGAETGNQYGGQLLVLAGGTVSGTIVNSAAYMYVSAYGAAFATTVTNGGRLFVYTNGTADDTIISSGAEMHLEGAASGLTVNEAGLVIVSHGATVGDFMISSGGIVNVANGATVMSGEIKGGGTMTLLDGAVLNGTITVDGSITDGDGLSSLVIAGTVTSGEDGACVNINISGNKPSAISQQYAISNISGLDAANIAVTVDPDDQLFGTYVIARGSAASSATYSVCLDGEYYTLDPMTSGMSTVVAEGAYDDRLYKFEIVNSNLCVTITDEDDSIRNYVLYEGENLKLGAANEFTHVGSDGTTSATFERITSNGLYGVASGLVASSYDETTGSRGLITMAGTSYDFVLEYADMVLVPDYEYSNPNLFLPDIIVPSHAYNTIVRNGTLQVNANTSAISGSIETENGIVSVKGGGYLEGFDVAAGSMFVESDGVAADLSITGSGTLFNSGRVSDVTVGEGGVVSQGRTDAVLSAIELNTNGTIDTFTQVGTDAATIDVMSGNAITGNASGLEYVGDLTVTKGGTLTDTIVSSGTLAMTNSATASATTVLGGGVMSLNYRATATGTKLEDGAILDVNVNGSALDTVVQSGAVMNVNSSGYAKDVDLTSGGILVISGQQATVTGRVELGSAGHMIASGTVAVDSATRINIDISADAPVADEESEHDYRVDNFNALTAATITVTVDANQELGAYILGTGAAEFAGTLTVRTNDDAFTGTLNFSVNNGQLENGNIVYNLYTDTYGRLYIKVAEYTVENDTTPPDAPVAVADITEATNGNVIVSATFSDDTAVAEYSLDGSTWNAYTEGILFETNGTVCFRATDAAGNVSDVTEFAVTNIDKIAPEAPVASADITEATQQNVIVSATFSDDTAVMEYSLDGDTWQAYTAGVEFSDNGTIYFRATDAVGNVSAMTRYDVTNIDRVAPDAPVAAADITEATNGNVTVTATVNETGAVLEYSLDGGTTWNVYTDGIVMEENGTVSFRATDAAGNVSDVTSLEVSNIDKIAPEAPTAAADITEMTTGDVTVSATFSNDSVTTEYSLDGETWVAYPDGGIIMSVNGTVYFRGIDAAGNISDVVSYEVTNITVAGPEAPVVSADITEPTNTDVVVSAVFGSDVTSKQYSLDGKNWKAYPANGVVMEENGTVYFRGVNADGVYSDVVSYEVTNIDKVAPEQPVVIADITDATNKNVTVSATFSDDSAKTEYSLDGETWTAYPDGGVVMEENGTVYFRGIDAAGNISDVTSIEVANIDKEAPQQPVASANITSETTGTVTVSAVFSNDTALKEYSLDGTTWQIYTTGIVFEENGFVYFRATDAVGNVSEVTSFEVSNIIVIGPEKPVVSADITTPTNGNVTVSATFGSDTVTQQYSLDGTTWQIYTAGIVFEENGLIYFRGLNEEGNPSDVVSYEVSNIDKVAPVKPVASADITKTTNKNVIVSAQYSADTVTQQYSLDGTTWQAYTTGIVFAENGAVYFRSIDAAGNISEVTNYEVTNIDKIAPVAPSASADITQDTNESVTIYATFSADSAVKEFSYDGKVWHDYTKYNGITMTQNGTVYFRGVDEAGNVSDVVSYEVTNIVTGSDAPNGINTEVNEYKVTYTWNKLELEKGQKAVYTVIINGEEYDTKSNKLKLSKQAPGTYTYQVMATVSQKGMPSYETLVSESQTITVYDVTAPKKGKIEIGEITKDSVTINLTEFSDNVGIVDYEVFLDGVSLGRTNGATSFTYEKMDVAGKLTFSAVAYDEAGLVSKVAKKKVTVEDITAPTAVTNVTVVGEADEDLVELTWDASTDNVGVVKYEVLINGKTYTTKTNSISIKKLDAGTFDVEVVAIDKAKKESAAGTCEVTVKDITAPKAVSVKAKVENNDVTFTWKASTDNVGVEGYIMKYGVAGTDSRFWTNEFEFGASDTMFEIEGLDMGSYAYEMVAFDAAGNESKVKSGKFNVKTALMSEDLMPAGNIDLMSWQDGYTDAAFSAAVDSMLDDKDKLLASDTMQLA